MATKLRTGLGRLALALLGLGVGPAMAQMTVLEGVYDASQARRGAMTYQRICAECHEGSEPDGDPLVGPVFIERWREATLGYLFDFISQEMPGNDAGGLSDSANLDVLAYLLQQNDYPQGRALEQPMLSEILMVGEDGPAALPLYSLVLAVGCLHLEEDTWRLNAASRLFRVRTADETNDEEVSASAELDSIGGKYLLRNAQQHHAAHKNLGQRVQIKGVLNAHGEESMINVLSLAPLGQSCGGNNN